MGSSGVTLSKIEKYVKHDYVYVGVDLSAPQRAEAVRFAYSCLRQRYGTIEASWDNARAAFAAGAAGLVYPGGDWETHRPSWHSSRVEFHHREGFVKLALETGVPIVPVVSIARTCGAAADTSRG